MRTPPSLPESIELGRAYSFRADLVVNGWAWVAVATSFVGEVILLPAHPEWPVIGRVSLLLVPFLAALLWVRSVSRWVRSMDELHRRITLAASLFATVSTLFIVGGAHLLTTAGLIQFHASAGFVIIWLVVCFYLLGRKIFNRRYA